MRASFSAGGCAGAAVGSSARRARGFIAVKMPAKRVTMMRAAADMTFEPAISFLESQIMTLALTEDAKEGRAGFIEKRAPVWTGK